jgi:hypothetical protein
MELAGDPNLQPTRDSDRVKTLADLKEEMPDLHPDLYDAFQLGVEFQLQGKKESALGQYQLLTEIQLSNKQEFDLSKKSKVLQHNLRLLEEKNQELSSTNT